MSEQERKPISQIRQEAKEYRENNDSRNRYYRKTNELYNEALHENEIENINNILDFDSLYKIHGEGEYKNIYNNKKFKITKDGEYYRFKNEDSTWFGCFPGTVKDWIK